MPKYLPYDYNQSEMVVINFSDQLQAGTFEHAIHYLVEHRLDLSIFDSKYKNDTTGRYAYNPAVLLKVILFAYSKGITSSREIQWCCETNITFMALAKNQCMKNPAAADQGHGNGRQVSFIIGNAKNKKNYTDWMKERVDSEEGKHIYSHRMFVVEPVFANIGTNKGLSRFSSRGKRKVQVQ